MKAEEISVARLFETGQQVIVPLWQRSYSWENTQLRELWEDIWRVRTGADTTHFVGSIVLHMLPWEGLPSRARQYWVIDGQQRITSLTLLICAIRDHLDNSTADPGTRRETFHSYSSQLLVNSNLTPGHQARLVLQEQDQESLKPIIEGTWSGEPETRVERAYHFFKTCLGNLEPDEVESVLTTVLTRISAVWVTLEKEDNAHRVFQTLNAGGMKLRQSDLIRNYFFLLLGEQSDSFYKKHWREMESLLKEKELERYFVAWSVSQGHSGGSGSLFNYFQKDLRDHEHDLHRVLAYGNDLVKTARLFWKMRDPSISGYSTQVQRSLQDLRNWGTLPADGLILSLLRAHDRERLTDAQLREALEIVLSFMARRQLAGYEPNLHKSIFTSVSRQVRSSSLSHEPAVRYLEFLLSNGKDIRTWPSDEQIKAEAASTPMYSPARRDWIFSILERVDRSMYDNPKHAPTHISRSKYSIEHVMPQSLTDEWESELREWGEVSPYEMYESRLHVLGNLTLTPINSELSNISFARKRIQLRDDSLRLNAIFSDVSSWSKSRVDERSHRLAQAASGAYAQPLRGAALQVAKERFIHLADDHSPFEASDADAESEDE